MVQIAFWSWFKGAEADIQSIFSFILIFLFFYNYSSFPALQVTPIATDSAVLSFITNDAWSSVGLGASLMMAGLVAFFANVSV